MPLPIREPEKSIVCVHETDLAIIGGSCTGVFAAVRAARLGARVALIEKQNCFGGMATAGAVNIWHSLNDTENRQTLIGGLTSEVIERLEMRAAVESCARATGAFRLNTEELKIELDDLVVGHGIKPFLNTYYCAPAMENKRLAAVIIENKNGRQALRARQFIDASGDGDLARDLGLPFDSGPHLQPPTLCAKIAGLASLQDFDWQAAADKHGHEFGLEKDWGWGSSIPGLPDLSLRADTHVFGTDVSDADQLTDAEIQGRRQVRAMLDVIRTYGPPEAHVALADLAAALGARESRRFRMRYRLTGDDVLYGRVFDDAIANGSYRVDIHHANGPGITFRYLDGTENVIHGRGQRGDKGRWREPLPEDPTYYQIPLRCLLQDRAPNLALAGRMLDADSVAFSAARVMVNLNQTGEAAGVACALALHSGGDVADSNAQAVRKTLADGGSIIMPAPHSG